MEVNSNGSKDQTEKNDERYPRDGRFIEEIGFYDPTKEPTVVSLDADKAKTWLKNGAQPTDTVKVILKKEGVL